MRGPFAGPAERTLRGSTSWQSSLPIDSEQEAEELLHRGGLSSPSGMSLRPEFVVSPALRAVCVLEDYQGWWWWFEILTVIS